MSVAIKEFVQEFLDADEKIESPILLADKVEIMTEGNDVIAEEEEPAIQTYEGVYCVNTNKRIVLASTGIFRSSYTESYKKTRLSSGIWQEENGAKVTSRVSHGFIFHTIKKGDIYNMKFNSGITGRSSFFAAEMKLLPGLIKLIAAIGVILLIAGFGLGFLYGSTNVLMVAFGIILAAVAFLLFLIKPLKFSSPAEIILENENNLTMVIHNSLEESKEETLENGKITKEITKLILNKIFLKIDFTETVTSKQLKDFVHSLGE